MKFSQYPIQTTSNATDTILMEDLAMVAPAKVYQITIANLAASLSSNLTGVVFTTGNQTIAGDKTFTGTTTFNNSTGSINMNGVILIGNLLNGATPTGGFISIAGSGANDNAVFMEFFSRDQTASASSLNIVGRFASNMPLLTLGVDNTTAKGNFKSFVNNQTAEVSMTSEADPASGIISLVARGGITGSYGIATPGGKMLYSSQNRLAIISEGANSEIVFATNGANNQRFQIKTDGTINITNVQVGNTGLVSGDVYKDASGFLKIV